MDGDGGARSEEAERRMEEEVRRAVEEARELQDAAAAHVARTSSEEELLRERTLALDSSICRLRASVGAQASSGLLDSKLADRLEEELQRARCIMADGDASSFLPSKSHGAWFGSFSFVCAGFALLFVYAFVAGSDGVTATSGWLREDVSGSD